MTCGRAKGKGSPTARKVRIPKRSTRYLDRASRPRVRTALRADAFKVRLVGDNKVYRRLSAINYGAGLRACRPIVGRTAGLSRFFRRQIDHVLLLLLINVPALLYIFAITSAAIWPSVQPLRFAKLR